MMPFTTASSGAAASNPRAAIALSLFTAFWFASFAGTTDPANWWIENLLVFIFVGGLIATYRRFVFSDLSYALIFTFLVLHVYGAKYAYAGNPFGFRVQAAFHTLRNPYDRIVHTSFGLLMAYPMRELLIRRFGLSPRLAWILPVEFVLSLSGLFELVEWSIADIFFPEHGQNYVGTQGDIWDAQKDMFVATSGAAVAMLAGACFKAKSKR
jgi:putative membrane protein